MTSVARKNEELVFQCDKWLSNKDDESENMIELPATKNGKPLATGNIDIYFTPFTPFTPFKSRISHVWL